MDKIMEESVSCRVRAKRGCATHPRSIAERVRIIICNKKKLKSFLCTYLNR